MSEKLKNASEMDACINKYLEYKEKLEENEKKVQKYRTNIKLLMKKSGEKEYSSSVGKVTINQANKNSLSKKNLPKNYHDIWEKYSTKTSYDIVTVKAKK